MQDHARTEMRVWIGFLNGLFSAVRNQHVREVKCIAAGDPYCEWEIT